MIKILVVWSFLIDLYKPINFLVVEFKYGQGNDTAEVEEELENAEV